jgi:hypothetical protein
VQEISGKWRVPVTCLLWAVTGRIASKRDAD